MGLGEKGGRNGTYFAYGAPTRCHAEYSETQTLVSHRPWPQILPLTGHTTLGK